MTTIQTELIFTTDTHCYSYAQVRGSVPRKSKNISGYFFLNAKAKPLPITPTQLTGLTRVVHLEENKLPFINFIVKLETPLLTL